MASFDINFQANTTGDHYVGWRTYDMLPNTYNVETINVTIPGAQTVTIEVDGSLYCANSDIQYTGYVIAACMNQNDGNADGIPDLALTWTIDMVQQIDPCIKTRITCDNVPLNTINITNKGDSYTSPPTVTVTAPDVVGGVQAAGQAFLGNGVITTLFITNFGGQYEPIGNASTTQTVDLIRLGQVATDGTLGTVDVTFDIVGNVASIALNTGGSGYTTADKNAPLTFDYSQLISPGAPTGPAIETQFIASCANSFVDEVNAITVEQGSGYQTAPTIGFTGGGGSGAAATAVLETACSALDLSDYECGSQNDLSDIPIYTLDKDDYVDICADVTTLVGLPLSFEDSIVTDVSPLGNCHCEPCTHVTITAGGTSGKGKITYFTCWDGSNGLGDVSMVSQAVTAGESIDLGCIIESTLTIDNGNLAGGTPTITVTSSVNCT